MDEVLAVGDAAFQKKCLGKMTEVRRERRTILFVSHNMGAVLNLCSRAILLEGGRKIADGAVDEVVNGYLTKTMAQRLIVYHCAVPPNNRAWIARAAFLASGGKLAERLLMTEALKVECDLMITSSSAIRSVCRSRS